ncbi:hypothetical protein, partial [Rhizobium leguminosarum]|uniref:hypothetical protein n=1 Tax=Rhizobium leguminosarum TaxID=384 RepID=UPI0019D4E90C
NTFSPSETGRAVVINELRYNARTPSTTPKGPLLLTAMLRCMLMAEVYTQGWSSVNGQRC